MITRSRGRSLQSRRRRTTGKRIAVIGGGSIYTAGIIRTLVDRADEFAGASVVLEDLRPERQQTILALGRNLIRARGADLMIGATLELEEALDGADFVITCSRVGGRQALQRDDPQFDMSLPGMHQYVGSVSDLAVSVIAAILGDRREVVAVNLPNTGQIANLPRAEIVESPAVVGAFGAQPIAVGDPPERVLPITEILARAPKLTVDAALSGDKERLLAALMSDPLVDSITKAKPMMEEMLAAQAQWLPQFAR